MIAFPNCKINIGLNIINKRDDGFHNLESVFYPVSLCDILEITENKNNEPTQIINTGLVVDCPMEKNLCFKAYQLLKKDFDLPEVTIHLHKIIPFGAGLGGGSSDAAFSITLLNSLFSLNLSNEKMREYAAILGSDCAFFIENKAAIATGRGEILKPIELNLLEYSIILVKPQINISTAEAFSGLKPETPNYSLQLSINQHITEWKNALQNDFEKHLFLKYPILSEIKSVLYQQGALYAAMSGSGSTIYGIFEKGTNFKHLKEIFATAQVFEIQ